MCKKIWLGIDVGQERLYVAIAPVGTHVTEWATMPVEEFDNNAHSLRSVYAWVKRMAPALAN